MSDVAEIANRLDELEKKFATAECERDEYRRLYLEMMERCRKLELGFVGSKTGDGHPPGWGGATARYQPRGGAPPMRVAMKAMGKLKGEDFTGRYVRMRVDRPERVAGVADLEARVVRRCERVGDPAGEEVGGVYRRGELRIEADRNSVTIKRGRRWIEIEPEENLSLERLLAVEGSLHR